jgi:hypothetical protein
MQLRIGGCSSRAEVIDSALSVENQLSRMKEMKIRKIRDLNFLSIQSRLTRFAAHPDDSDASFIISLDTILIFSVYRNLKIF